MPAACRGELHYQSKEAKMRKSLCSGFILIVLLVAGIGPALAQRILDFRQASGPFERIEDVMEVSGIGQGIFDQIRDLITTE